MFYIDNRRDKEIWCIYTPSRAFACRVCDLRVFTYGLGRYDSWASHMEDISSMFIDEFNPTGEELDYFEMMYGKCYRDALVFFITHLERERLRVNKR